MMMASKKAKALVAGVSVLDVVSILSHIGEVMALLSSCYSLAMEILRRLGGKLPMKALPGVDKASARMSFEGFLNMLRSLEGALKQVVALLDGKVLMTRKGGVLQLPAAKRKR